MVSKHPGTATAVGVLMAICLVVTGCGQQEDDGGDEQQPGGTESTANGFKIGLLLPESKTTRYETFDRPLIQEQLSQLCSKCEVLYQNADQDPAKQQSQAEAMLTQGVKVMILDPVDARAAGAIVNNARSQNVPVVSYDRLAEGPISYYVSYDNRKVGEVQGQALLDALSQDGQDPKRGDIVMINGSPTDPNAADFKAGAHSVLDGKVNIGQEYDTPDWSPDRAQQQMEQAITALGRERIIGVYAANDGTAGGAIAAMKGSGFPSPLPPVTGQDAELAGIQRIVSGEQYMTVYKAIRPEAEVAAAMAVAAATGQQYTGRPTEQRDNGTTDVPSVLLEPVVVTRDNIEDTVIQDGFYTPAQICSGAFAEPCAAAGIS
ncbi:D-xylose transport system substrate-binding protein [Micromonospora phaseoli]|uniref:D-xylose transport system substrate-binding protein n=1 Tax=Micromonospora phaseoli TaxID=1144548 RepID=A0A1H6VFH0_9ACTN|nr:sugar ABC transporter substrate-binding protein [Micromonospora phaseoli]PZV93729.1 D-xylose transport system substrate-binding protein [Micromonospora phaseoli]GIJ79210.1 solute-binding protein [Micromonospora phaseoli]SEI99062.1 D-xylose transport system substrate-binding protein [Micromonospora phaseoli]